MRFGEVAVGEAEGALLAHSLRLGTRTLKKGRVLDSADVAELRDAGYASVVVARLDADDVGEDEAAQILARAAAGEGVRAGAAFTGRCNLQAEHDGLLVLDAERIDAMNRIDEGLTIATLAPFTKVTAKTLLATVKVIPFGVARESVEAAEACLRGAEPAVRVVSFRRRRVALLQTTLPGTKATVLDKTVRVIRARLEALGAELVREVRCPHTERDVAREVAALGDSGADIVLVAGASAIVDRRDVVPAGIVRAGGDLDHFGMPVDPGNLMLLAHRGTTPVLGLPGCARSPKFNGFDQVLERLAAGLPVASGDMMSLGVGGLLKEIAERPQPRAARKKAPARSPRIAAVVLAAGRSRRMGGRNKLLEPIAGVAMITRVADAASEAGVESVYVVTGHERDRVEQALEGRDVRFVHNPRFAEGLSTSLACGLAALPEEVDGALVCLGDMPRITPRHIDRLLAAFDPVEGRDICVPTYEGRRGHPVLWARRFFGEMMDVKGDVGARHLLGEHPESVCEVAMSDDAVVTDVDSPASLHELCAAEERSVED